MSNTPYKIINLGDVGWTDLNDAFKNNTSLEAVTIGAGINQLSEMINTFNGCINLKEINVVDWDITNITSLRNFLKGVRLDTDSYSSMLVHFADSTSVNVGVVLHGGDSFFNNESQAARDTLVNVYQWDITDGGLQPEWVQILSTDSEGNMFDFVSNTSIPKYVNKKCVRFFDQDYIDTNIIIPTFPFTDASVAFDISFEFEIENTSAQFIMGNLVDGSEGFNVQMLNGKLYIYLVGSIRKELRMSPSGIAPTAGRINFVRIYSPNDSTSIYFDINGNVGESEYVQGWGVATTPCTTSFVIGRDPDDHSDYFTGRIANVHFKDQFYFPLEENYGSECCNTVVSSLGNVPGTIINKSDISAMRTVFSNSSSIPTYYWKHGFNKIDDFTTSPSLYDKTLGKFQIDSAESYAVTETPYHINTVSDSAMIVEFLVYDNQDASDSLICSLGDPRSPGQPFLSLRYNGSGVYIRFTSSSISTVKNSEVGAILPNTKYKIDVQCYKPGGYPGYYSIKYYLYKDDVLIYETSTEYHSSTNYINTIFNNFYIGQPPIDPSLNIAQDSCLCTIDSVSCQGCVDDSSKFIYSTQLENLYTLYDLFGNGLNMQIYPINDIFNSWIRTIDDQDGIIVDCSEYKEIKYPPCKDGIIHNGDSVIFVWEDPNLLQTIIGVDENNITSVYKYFEMYNDKPVWKDINSNNRIYYDASENNWKMWNYYTTGPSNVPQAEGTGYYPPDNGWSYNFSVTFEDYYPSYIDSNGYAINKSFSDILLLNRDDDKTIIEKHITDTNATVVDKIKIVEV